MTRSPFQLEIHLTGPPGGGFGNTAEPSRELSVGDLVCSGGTWLAVAKAGWTRVSGTVNKARVDQYGTHPLPGDSVGEETE